MLLCRVANDLDDEIAGPMVKEMLDFCGKHNITADIEKIAMEGINTAYERMLKGDVKYRFVIDMATLAQT